MGRVVSSDFSFISLFICDFVPKGLPCPRVVISFSTFLRGQNMMVDPVTRHEMEEKRRRHMEHQV